LWLQYQYDVPETVSFLGKKNHENHTGYTSLGTHTHTHTPKHINVVIENVQLYIW